MKRVMLLLFTLVCHNIDGMNGLLKSCLKTQKSPSTTAGEVTSIATPKNVTFSHEKLRVHIVDRYEHSHESSSDSSDESSSDEEINELWNDYATDFSSDSETSDDEDSSSERNAHTLRKKLFDFSETIKAAINKQCDGDEYRALPEEKIKVVSQKILFILNLQQYPLFQQLITPARQQLVLAIRSTIMQRLKELQISRL